MPPRREVPGPDEPRPDGPRPEKPSRRGRGRLTALLVEHPLLLAAVSAGFLALTLWLCADHGWRLTESIGSGRRSAPLWVVALIGLPLWTTGVAAGIWRAIRPRRSP